MSSMKPNSLAAEDRATLLAIARQSIQQGLHHGCPLEVDSTTFPPSLQVLRATFVTLEIEGRLRGCIGALQAHLPLVIDVANHAFAAAFSDPRFPRLREEDLPKLRIHLSILSPPEAMVFSCEDELLKGLRPGVDGLILRLGERRATFLPAVWDVLPDPYLFLAQLKYKAGLPLDFWSDALEVERYTTESFGEASKED